MRDVHHSHWSTSIETLRANIVERASASFARVKNRLYERNTDKYSDMQPDEDALEGRTLRANIGDQNRRVRIILVK